VTFFVGHSTAGKLQVITGPLSTTWMLGDYNGAPWTPVVPFATEPPSFPGPAQENGGLPANFAWAMAGAQLAASNQDSKLPNNGRLQVWALYTSGGDAVGGASGLWSVTKSTEQVNAPWNTWQSFGLPPQADGDPWDLCVTQLNGGRLQIWVNYVETPAQKSLWTKIMDPASADPWSGAWEAFDPGGDPGHLFSPCGTMLRNGKTVLWALGSKEAVPDGPMPVYFTTRSASTSGTATSGWNQWQPFTVEQGAEFPKAWSLQSGQDGAGRSYLWALTAGRRGVLDTIQYSYYPGGATAPQSAEWSGASALPPAAQASAASTVRVLGSPALPDGNIELFYVPLQNVSEGESGQPDWPGSATITQSTSDPSNWPAPGWQPVSLTLP
jgi:hypothetical protein